MVSFRQGTPPGSSEPFVLPHPRAAEGEHGFGGGSAPKARWEGASLLAGNVRRLRDANGHDLGGYRYTAFGQAFPADATTPAPAIDQPLRWKGRPFDEVTALYDMRARWWSPQLGAFVQIDQYAYHDANSTLWGWPGRNPVRWADPFGRYGLAFGFNIGYAAGVGTTNGGYIEVGLYWDSDTGELDAYKMWRHRLGTEDKGDPESAWVPS